MDNLRAWLEENDKTQEWLASKIGATQGSVSHWCIGRYKPGAEMLLALSEITGLTLEQLLDREKA